MSWSNDFREMVEFILKHEGGYVWDKHDPGGETKYGISKRSYPHVDIKKLTKQQARSIYKRDYWNECQCDKLPRELRLIIFDCAVNQGAHYAKKTLQRIVGAVPDGNIGPKTLVLVDEHDPLKLLTKFADRRLKRYLKNKNIHRYGYGWLRRLGHCLVITNKGE